MINILSRAAPGAATDSTTALCLSLVSIAVSATSLFLTWREHLYRVGRRIFLEATCHDADDSLTLTVTSEGARPIRLRSIRLLYGVEPAGTAIWQSPLTAELRENETMTKVVTRDELVAGCISIRLSSSYNCRLWLVVDHSRNKRTSGLISLPSRFLTRQLDPRAHPFAATDAYLNLKPLEPRVNEPIHTK
jgi:hypothetical protein